jgi:hypothetical protein
LRTESIRQRAERGVILAAIQKPAKIDGYYVVSGWFCDLDSYACDDHRYGGGTCKHMFAAAIWERLRSYGGLPTRRTNLAPSDSLKNSNQAALHRSFARDVEISTVSRAAS